MTETIKILVVEDDYFISKNICDILESEGYQVINDVCSVEKAINEIEKEKPNLVLIDIGLIDGDDGIKIGQYLTAKRDTPFIYVTSSTDENTLKRVKLTNPSGYIVKPFKTADFKITVSLVLNSFYNMFQLNSNQNTSGNSENYSYRIRKVLEYIENNINTKPDLVDLSELTKWKTHHFIRIFNKEVGLTPYQYILKTKIDLACKLIQEGDKSLISISEDLGFQNYIGFWRAFKKFTNNTPENYYKNIRKTN